jgi:hypothetical protein
MNYEYCIINDAKNQPIWSEYRENIQFFSFSKGSFGSSCRKNMAHVILKNGRKSAISTNERFGLEHLPNDRHAIDILFCSYGRQVSDVMYYLK